MGEHKQCSYSLRKSGKMSVQETKWSHNSMAQTRPLWQGLQTIMDYKGKTTHVADTNVLLPDKLNTFAPIEDNVVPPTWPGPKDCKLMFPVVDASKIFKRVNPCRAAGQDGVTSSSLSMCRPVGWSVYRHIQSLPIPVSCPLLQDVHHYSCTQESKGNPTK
jgi:hypothetical protein